MAHKFKMDDVEHITSKAIHVSQNSAPNIQYPVEHDFQPGTSELVSRRAAMERERRKTIEN